MGILRYAILGLLNRTDMTGYDLSKEFQSSLIFGMQDIAKYIQN